jgi:acetolactate synthase-1/2/3 large subunit
VDRRSLDLSISQGANLITVADAILSIFDATGLVAGFGMPGGQTAPFYKAARERGFRHVLMRDERNAACAADSYARVSGKVGCCDATVGPGVTNLVSGLAEAYASSVPVLVLIADIDTQQEHLRHRAIAMQAMEQRALLEPVTKWIGRISKPEMLTDCMAHALRVATSGRPGPVVIEFPEEVMRAEMPAPDLSSFSKTDACWPRARSAATRACVVDAVARIAKSKRPIILAGGGAIASGAYQQMVRFAELGIPVVTTLNGKGIIDERHPRALGPVGVFGKTSASRALQQADLVLALGTKFSCFNTFSWKLPNATQDIIHVDVDPEELGRTIPTVLGIVADIREASEQIVDALSAKEIRFNWQQTGDIPVQPGTAPNDPAVPPEQVVMAVNDIFDERAIVVSDASLASGWTATRFAIRQPGRHFLAPRGFGGLGWSCGAAIGAAVAAPEGTRLVVFAGDGAAAYWLGEIETAVRLKLPITFVVLNNSSLGWQVQLEKVMGLEEVSRFSQIDFSKVGQGMGAAGVRARSMEEVKVALLEASRTSGPFVLDVLSSEAACASVSFQSLSEQPSSRPQTGAYRIE